MIYVSPDESRKDTFSISDEQGEFGFIKKNEKFPKWEFKITEEKYLTVDDVETIASYMRTIIKYDGAV